MNLQFLVTRFITALGSLMTTMGAIIYLTQANRADEIPYILVTLSLGIFFASKFIVPALGRFSTRSILVATELIAFVIVGVFLIFTQILSEDSLLSIWGLVSLLFLLSLLSTINSSVSQSYFGGVKSRGKQLVTADMSMTLLARVIAPLTAGFILSFNNLSLLNVIFVDFVSYAFSAYMISRFVLDSKKTTQSVAADKLQAKEHGFSFLYTIKQEPVFWLIVVLFSIGISFFQSGSVIYITQFNATASEVSSFLSIQSFSMLISMVVLVRWPVVDKPKLIPAFIATLGIFSFAISENIYLFTLCSMVVAGSMGFIWASFRVHVASFDISNHHRRFNLGLLATLISSFSVIGLLISKWAADFIGWQNVFYIGAFALLTATGLTVAQNRLFFVLYKQLLIGTKSLYTR